MSIRDCEDEYLDHCRVYCVRFIRDKDYKTIALLVVSREQIVRSVSCQHTANSFYFTLASSFSKEFELSWSVILILSLEI